MDLTEPTTVGLNALNRSTGASTLASITVPTVVGAGATVSERHAASREIASWRQLKMWLDGENLQTAVTVKLIGVHEGKSLLITSPDDTQLYLREGRLYRFRSFSGEFVYEFVAPLLKVCTAPFALPAHRLGRHAPGREAQPACGPPSPHRPAVHGLSATARHRPFCQGRHS